MHKHELQHRDMAILHSQTRNCHMLPIEQMHYFYATNLHCYCTRICIQHDILIAIKDDMDVMKKTTMQSKCYLFYAIYMSFNHKVHVVDTGLLI